MIVEVRDPRLRAVIDPEIDIERVATGFEFTEGPIWHPQERHLIFSDMPGDHMRRWRAGEGITTFRKPSNMANGNAYDRSGRIVTCEHATSRVTRTGPDGRVDVLATHWQGLELNSPNDVVVKSDGAIYFTDPTFGRMEYYGRPREPELAFRGVYRLDPETRDALAARRRLRPAERAVLRPRGATSVRQRHRARPHPAVRRQGGRHARQRSGLGGAGGRGSGRAGWHEDRRRRQPVLHRSGRPPRLRAGCRLPRRDRHSRRSRPTSPGATPICAAFSSAPRPRSTGYGSEDRRTAGVLALIPRRDRRSVRRHQKPLARQAAHSAAIWPASGVRSSLWRAPSFMIIARLA